MYARSNVGLNGFDRTLPHGMRVAHIYIGQDGPDARTATLDETRADFAETHGYSEVRFESRDQMLASARAGWNAELYDALQRMMTRGRQVLSVGAGMGEREALFASEGYDVVASDFLDTALDEVRRLFPELRTMCVDILDPGEIGRFDDILVAALDYALDDERFEQALRQASRLLNPDGRVILVQRYHDNLATRCIDQLLLPLWARRRRSHGFYLVRKPHGYRRRRREIVVLANRAGYRVGRRDYAGYGVELTRFGLDLKAPRFYRMAQSLDRRLHILTTATIFELLPMTDRSIA